jgi:tetratricopeptide (TPR) repeat protein
MIVINNSKPFQPAPRALASWLVLVLISATSLTWAQEGPPPGGMPPKEEPVTVPPADFDPVKLLVEGQRAFEQGKYAEAVAQYANPIINYYAYRYGTRGRRMFVAHDAAETALYVATGARALDIATDEGVVNGVPLPPAAYGSRNIVIPVGTLSDAFSLKGRALAKQSKLDDALLMLTRSTVLSPSYASHFTDLADLDVQMGRCDEAAKAYAQAEEALIQLPNASDKAAQATRAASGKAALMKCRAK